MSVERTTQVTKFARAYLLATLVVTVVTAWFSYAFFHPDEHFQIIEFARLKLGHVAPQQLPWEHAQRMRPWLQPFVYWLVARALLLFGIRDIFDVAFVCRLLTGLANVGALALFLRTTMAWMPTDEEKRLHVRIVTMLGFLPYLFVRTSSESGSMAAMTAAFALLLEGATASKDGRTWTAPALERPLRCLLAGALLGFAVTVRFQTAFFVLGVAAWLRFVGGCSLRTLFTTSLGGAFALACGALVDRWGYGAWTFPAWTYFRANILEGGASLFGNDPPFSYFWLLPANIFMPVVVTLLLLAVTAWLRCPLHPVTWATLPMFVSHNLISHKEERFLFPIAILSTALVTMAIGPSFGAPRFGRRLIARIAAFGWTRRHGWLGKSLGGASMAGMLLLAFYPLGWNHHVRFARFVHDEIGDEVHATVLPEVDLHLPAFHPSVWDVDKADPEEIARRLDAGTARQWLITDRPILRTGTSVDARAALVFSELPVFRYPSLAEKTMRLVEAYNANAPASMRRLRFRSLYRLEP